MTAGRISVVVVGAGIAGLASTLAFARAGHEVTLVERDGAPAPMRPDQSFLEWERPGVPQRRLLHGFLPLARRVLRERLPDLVERLHEVGAHDVDLLEPLESRGIEPGDDDLFALRCRRTVFEWVLRRAAEAEPRVRVLAGDAAAGLVGEGPSGTRLPTVTGVRLRSGARVAGDLVVDAAGRQSRLADSLPAIGGTVPERESSDCGLVYYTRFYRRPDDGFPVAVQANYGWTYVNAIAADGRTFSLTFMVRSDDAELRVLRQEEAFEAAVNVIPGFEPWRAGASPIGPVGAMGALQNEFRHFVVEGRPPAAGLIPVGDSLSHTNPSLGRGMSLALDQAFRAAALPWARADLEACAIEYHRQVGPAAAASHADAVESDRVAAALHRGEPGAEDEPRALLTAARPLAAAHDHELYRAWVRNNGLLTFPGAFVAEPWIGRARRLVERFGRRAPGAVSRDHLVEALGIRSAGSPATAG